jgi:proteasome lid subunit RPN8/RPN11
MYLFAGFRALLIGVREAFPKEASGILVQQAYKRVSVLSLVATSSEINTPTSFRIEDDAIESVQRSLAHTRARVCGYFHSHIGGPARPSSRDVAGAKDQGELWLIYSVRFRDLRLFRWNGAAFERERFRLAL